MIAVYKIGGTGRNVRDHRVPLCGSAMRKLRQGSGLAQISRRRPKINLAELSGKELSERALSTRHKCWESWRHSSKNKGSKVIGGSQSHGRHLCLQGRIEDWLRVTSRSASPAHVSAIAVPRKRCCCCCCCLPPPSDWIPHVLFSGSPTLGGSLCAESLMRARSEAWVPVDLLFLLWEA